MSQTGRAGCDSNRERMGCASDWKRRGDNAAYVDGKVTGENGVFVLTSLDP